jgi:CheY-like chemotaxis protein
LAIRLTAIKIHNIQFASEQEKRYDTANSIVHELFFIRERYMRIGIVEDDYQTRIMLKEGLSLSGNQVEVYSNAQECINAVLGARFNGHELPHDILVTDLELGIGIDGAEMIRRMRQFIGPQELPCIIMSGNDLQELHLLRENLFDIRILQKPLTSLSLLKEVKRLAATQTGAAH